MHLNSKIIFSVLFSILSYTTASITYAQESVQENKQTVNQWNTFVDNIYKLHLKQASQKHINTTKRSGSYYRRPDFFQEIKYFDKNTNNLLSRIEWETKNPEKIHSIEVIIRDKKDNVIREYSASYLPDFRNAPYQTLINLHHHSENLHSYRQFDASDNLIYEVCKSNATKDKLFEHDDYEIPDNYKHGVGAKKVYQQCFKSLPRTAKLHLKPH